jgi:hypothetical protein
MHLWLNLSVPYINVKGGRELGLNYFRAQLKGMEL